MQQHPVPQHISSYEFKLVGDMTLKQFFQLAGGIVISLIFYATPLPGFIKWPLVILFGLLGAALAFLPIEERPLSQWAFAFIKAIYSPTQFAWDAQSVEDVFAKGTPLSGATGTLSVPPESDTQVGQSVEEQKFELAEKNFFSRVTAMFAGTPHVAPIVDTQFNQQAMSAGSFAAGSVLTQNQEGAKARVIPTAPTSRIMEMAQPVPTNAPVKVDPVQAQVPQQAPTQGQAGILTPVYSPSASEGQVAQSAQAVFAPEAAPPAPPERPNTIVGQVLTHDGKIVEGAIMEIKDAQTKTPVRALRSNKVGHFITVTPVQNGVYEILTEKDGLVFDTLQFTAEGRLIPPIQIKAK